MAYGMRLSLHFSLGLPLSAPLPQWPPFLVSPVRYPSAWAMNRHLLELVTLDKSSVVTDRPPDQVHVLLVSVNPSKFLLFTEDRAVHVSLFSLADKTFA